MILACRIFAGACFAGIAIIFSAQGHPWLGALVLGSFFLQLALNIIEERQDQ